MILNQRNRISIKASKDHERWVKKVVDTSLMNSYFRLARQATPMFGMRNALTETFRLGEVRVHAARGVWYVFEELSNNEISNALDRLVECIGVKEEVSSDNLVTLLHKGDIQECVQQIALLLGLPIRIRLSFVTPEDYKRPEGDNRFQTSALVQADPTGGVSEGIIAQVSIPAYLPMFGSSALEGYPIQVRVSQNCRKHPFTFITIMAHELSHVLLASLSHPQKDSELFTDIVPILLGFRDIARIGRKSCDESIQGMMMTKATTTYGYLTDSQFDYAYYYVTGLLKRYRHHKGRLLETVEKMQVKLKTALHSLASFRDYFDYLDRRRPKRMSKEHALRVVQLHAYDHSIEWENRLIAFRDDIESAELFAQSLDHYTSRTIEHLNNYVQELQSSLIQLTRLVETIKSDEKILRRYVGFLHRLRRTL